MSSASIKKIIPCKKKDLESPQWLRNVKDRKYPFYRLDTFFSKKKYIDKYYIKDGGWHFSNLKTASDIKSLKPVEPYKAKGIKEKGQFVLRKEGKKK